MKNKIYSIHENDEWIVPLRNELQEIKGMKSIAKFLKEELLLLNNIRVVA